MSEENGSKKLTVSEFGKVAVVGAAVMGLGKYFFREGVESKEMRGEWRIISGGDGCKYIPVYEEHKHPWPADKLTTIPDVDIMFYEVPRNAKVMAKANFEALTGKADDDFARDRWVQEDHLQLWSKRGTFITFEGLDYPAEAMVTRLMLGQLVEGFGGLYALIGSFMEKGKTPITIKDKQILSGELKRDLLKYGGIWGSSNFLDIGVRSYMAGLGSLGSEQLKRVPVHLQRIQALISQGHPEFDLVFLRNMLMARRLQAIGQHFPIKIRESDRVEGEPPTLAYTVGAQHSGIEDWLELGSDFVKLGLELWPTSSWKKLAELNGDPKDMATIPLARKGSLLFGDKVIHVKDEWFERFLLRKVDREE